MLQNMVSAESVGNTAESVGNTAPRTGNGGGGELKCDLLTNNPPVVSGLRPRATGGDNNGPARGAGRGGEDLVSPYFTAIFFVVVP